MFSDCGHVNLCRCDVQDEENSLVLTTEDTQRPSSSRRSTSPDSPASLTPPEGLKASLTEDQESTLRWVDEAPLRLVAAVLVDSKRRTAKVADIRSALTPGIIESEDWNKWWRVVQVGLRESRYFSYSPRQPIRLRTHNPAEVDSYTLDQLRTASRKSQNRPTISEERLASSPSISGLGGWILWVLADEEEPMPRSLPSDDFVLFLKRMPESVAQRALSRLSLGIEQRLVDAKQDPADTSVKAWESAFVAALNRWSELSYSPDVSIQGIVALVVRVLEARHSAVFQDVSQWIATYAAKRNSDTEAISDALLSVSAVAPTGTENLLGRLSGQLDSSTKVALWRQLISSGLRRADIPPIGQWVRILDMEDKVDVFIALLTTTNDESSITRIGDLLEAEWKRADSKQYYKLFNAVAVAWALHQQSVPVSKEAMLEAAGDGELEDEASLLSEWRSIINTLSEKERDRSEQRKTELERQLKDTKSELDRAERRIRLLRGENRSKRRSAEIEITRDAITVLGFALQDLATASKSQILDDTEAKIILALSTLGAKPFGSVGALAKFDPALHEATPTPVTGTPVRIVAPGLAYSRRSDTPAIFMKSLAQEEAWS